MGYAIGRRIGWLLLLLLIWKRAGERGRANVDRLLGLGQPKGQAGLLAVGRGAVHHALLGGLVKSGTERAQLFGGVILLSRGDEFQVTKLKRMEARLGAAIAQVLAGAVSHAAFG